MASEDDEQSVKPTETTGTADEQTPDELLVEPSTDLPGESGDASEESGTPEPTGPSLATRLGARLATWPPAAWAALRPRLTRLVLVLLAGWLMYASFPPVNWWWAAVISIALLSWVLMHPATTPAGGLGYGFLFGLAFYVPLLPWISTLVGTVPWLVLAAVCACYPALFGVLAVVVRRLPGWPIWFAVLWGAQEWFKSSFPFGGFPWGCIAFGQAAGPLLPLVQLGGVALLSTAVVLVGTSCTAIASEIVTWLRAGGAGSRRNPDHEGTEQGSDAVEAAKPPAVLLPGVSICLVLLAATLVWPQVRHSGAGSGGEPTITVAVVQGNVPRLGLEFNAQRRAVLDNHVSQTLRLAEDIRAGAAPQPQFVLWPEDSSDVDPLTNPDAAQQIAKAAQAVGAPILIGTVLDVPGRMRDTPEYTNTMIVWNPGTGPADRHHKAIVQPFGEYLPMPWLFSHLSGYADRAGHFVPVPGTAVVRIAGVPVGVSTCWEVVFDRAPRNAVLNGAQLLTVPSNNATFTKTMSEQQLAFARVRAVEHDRFVLVAGTTGISAVIAPDGAELRRTDFFVPDYLDAQVRLKTSLTPATRWGPIVQWALVAAAGILILVAIRHNGWFPRPTRRRSGRIDDTDDSDVPLATSEDDSETLNDSEPANDDVETANESPSGEGGNTHTGRNEGAT